MSDAFADQAPMLAGEPALVGASPWVLARRRLLRNRVAMAMVGVLVLIVALCLAAPLYAKHVAHTDPFQSHLSATTLVNGKRVPVMQQSSTGLGLGVTPIGPTWDPHHYLLGADDQGRDVAARLLYGGRGSLLVGGAGGVVPPVRAAVIRLPPRGLGRGGGRRVRRPPRRPRVG